MSDRVVRLKICPYCLRLPEQRHIRAAPHLVSIAENEILEDLIDEWHDGGGYDISLIQYLGMDWDQYSHYVELREVVGGWKPPAE